MKRLLLAQVVAAVAILVPATPASAHNVSAYVFNDNGNLVGVAHVLDVYDTLGEVCDNKADNVGVYARFKLSNGQIRDVSDPDGSGGSCGQFGTGSFSIKIVEFEAVWRGNGNGTRSSGWVRA